MSISDRLNRKLQQTLGAEAAQDFVFWMRQIDTRLSAMDTKLGSVEAKHDSANARLRSIEEKLGALDTKISDRFADLLKWSFVFWCSAVFAVAMLARVLP